MRPSQSGFTLIELIVIIVILGVLSAVAIPSYVNLQDKAAKAAEEAAVGTIRTGIALSHAETAAEGIPLYPDKLDSAKKGLASDQNPLFHFVVSHGGITRDWEKTSKNEYIGPNGGQYKYDKDTGEFRFVKQTDHKEKERKKREKEIRKERGY